MIHHKNSRKMSSAQCTEHNKALDMFCDPCDLMICSKCFLSSHSNHRILETEEVFRKRKGRIQDLIESTKPWQAAIKENTDGVRSSRQSMKETAEAIKAKIAETFKEWSDDLETMKQMFQRRVDEEIGQLMKVFDDHLAILNSAMKAINDLKTEMNITLSKDTMTIVQLCGSMEKSYEKVGKKANETMAISFVAPKALRMNISAPWMEEAIQNIKLVEHGKETKSSCARGVSMIVEENESLQRAIDDLQQKAMEYQSIIEDIERRKEEISYQLEDERKTNEELSHEMERIKEQVKVEWKTHLDDLKAKIVQTSVDQMESVVRHFENKRKSLSRLLDIHEEPSKLCPICNKSFPIDVADEVFENHVMDHVEGICPICRMTKGENMSDDDFMRHVNKHYEADE
ncbi:hypothetical protein CHS0354_026752 [Potamilus streckersoni]|uniref:B box-type domain-containing protein n=1 Tax=Potamilus streckersoni TaxID=2493646 RepID=A0AAE0RNJ7_9BIVA|nr:hypothetical protein CHS0354_026752 [Potamilus streckersoni]